MFTEDDVKKVFDKFDDSYFAQNTKLRYINNKIKNHGYLYINITELNHLHYLNAINTRYDIDLLKQLLHNNGIGYTSIIKKIGIPKATLSKLLNNDRNIKLLQLNTLLDKLNKVYNLNIDKNTIKREV